jgi:serine/threonine protein kinase
MSAIFSFDEVEYTDIEIKSKLDLIEDELDQLGIDGDDTFTDHSIQTGSTVTPAAPQSPVGPIPISVSKTPSKLSLLLKLDSAHETEDELTELGQQGEFATSYNARLGTSYEVSIHSNYVSSFAPDGRHKMGPEDFEPLKVLGQGAYGKVFLVKETATGRLFAQKQLKKASMVVEQKKIEQTKSERSILEAVRHPYIVRLFYALQDNQKLYLILEYAQGGELFTHLASERMFSEDVTSFYIAEMALALSHLHINVGVVYRDLKPENCLLAADGHLILTDFGLSKVAEDGSTCNSLLGTPEYMAPEILLGKEYDYSVDWWSLGAVCYDLLTGSPPFTGSTHGKIVEKITKSKLNLPYYLSADAKDLITRLLRKDPKKRLCHKDLATIKKHRFFRKLDWKKLETKDPDIVPPIVPIITNPALAENFSSEFTDMAISVEDRTGSLAAPSSLFKGFSFTASESYIKAAVDGTH